MNVFQAISIGALIGLAIWAVVIAGAARLLGAL